MIVIEERIRVAAPPEIVWSILSDPAQVVDCVPGASLGESHEDGSFDGVLTVQFGPLKIAFKARVKLTLDDTARTGHVVASGKDGQGGTRLATTANFKVEPETDGTLVAMDGDVEIKGRLASVVEGGAGVVVRRMTDQFAERLTKKAQVAAAGV